MDSSPASPAAPPQARQVQHALLVQPPYEGRIPTGEITRALFKKWLKRQNLFVCQKLTDRCATSCQTNRCSCEYWMHHSGLVARLMTCIARELNQSEALYYATGLLHDLDYPAAPHFPPGPENDRGHPLPLVVDLRALDVPPVLALAVLEHSPHLKLPPSSRLSAALIACDEAATLYAFGRHTPELPRLPQSVRSILAAPPVQPPLEGAVRPDVAQRMHWALTLAWSRGSAFVIRDAV